MSLNRCDPTMISRITSGLQRSPITSLAMVIGQ
jgi:hypothetical protein